LNVLQLYFKFGAIIAYLEPREIHVVQYEAQHGVSTLTLLPADNDGGDDVDWRLLNNDHTRILL
jgi:hypothetical protein